MATLLTLSTLIFLGVGLCIIIWYFFKGNEEYQVDLTRQNLFRIRNELFLKAAKGEISFDDEAYGIIRSTLNGSIYSLHHLTWFRFLVHLIFSKKFARASESKKIVSKRELAISKVSPYKRDIYEKALVDMHFQIIIFMIESSVFLTFIFNCCSLIRDFNKTIENVLSNARVQGSFKIIDAEACVIGTAT